MLVYQDAFKSSRNHDHAQALVDFLKWVLSEGQKAASDLSYVPLPVKFLPRVQSAAESIKY
jgi:ABC-type phosphate transport system substrate-binding protein